MKLSDAACRSAKPRAKDYKLGDGQGLFLLVQRNGSKLWRQYFRFQGRQTTMALGLYPAVGLADARELRDRNKRLIAFGRDPREVRRGDEDQGLSFRSVAKACHDAWKADKKPDYAEMVWGRLEADAFPYIGDKAIMDITSADILSIVRRVEARGAMDVSKRLKQKCSEVMAWAIAEGLIQVNPALGLDRALKPRPRTRHRRMVGDRGLPELLRAIDGYDGDKATRLALRFTLLTAVRTVETRFMEWGEVDGAIWRVPAARMKMHREHLVPLSRQAQEVLQEARQMARGALVFPGDGATAMSENTMLFALYRMGFHNRQTVHGFRRLFSTALNEHGWNRDWIELQLAHAERDDVRGAYNAAEYLAGRTEMMQWWADHLDRKRSEIQYEDLLG